MNIESEREKLRAFLPLFFSELAARKMMMMMMMLKAPKQTERKQTVEAKLMPLFWLVRAGDGRELVLCCFLLLPLLTAIVSSGSQLLNNAETNRRQYDTCVTHSVRQEDLH